MNQESYNSDAIDGCIKQITINLDYAESKLNDWNGTSISPVASAVSDLIDALRVVRLAIRHLETMSISGNKPKPTADPDGIPF